jgi:hypothetical protein
MKKVLLTLLGIIVALGLLAGAGFAGYRIGFNQGIRTVSAKVTTQLPQQNKGLNQRGMPFQNFGRGFGPQNMPMLHNFGNGFNRMLPGGFRMMRRGFGFFGLFRFLFIIVVFALAIWVVYMLLKNSGWRLTRQSATVTPSATVVAPQETESSTESKTE